MSKAPKYEAFTSPIGEAVFPWISDADTAFEADGVYHTQLACEPDTAVEFIDQLERVRNEFIATLPKASQQALNPVPVYTDELTRPEFPENATQEEKDEIKHNFVPEPTGRILFKFKLKKKVNLKDGESFTQSPTIVQADSDEPFEGNVFAGSLIRVRGPIVPYSNKAAGNVGVTLRMKAVQVIEAVSGDGGGAGFWTEFPS